ncbi:MAG TPA: acyl-CoA thioesterase II [Tepidiformaceae bacterium]|nr:acyl-CoA thioesterase II [Tepidiformaceae bacterium]
MTRKTPLETLLGNLQLERLDRDLFLGDPGPGSGRLFGGHVAAQSVMAAGMTLAPDAGDIHSLHAYFLRGGSHDVPIRFVVDRIRDGRTFSTRHVVAYQGGEAIFDLSASFARPEEGVEHQGVMPDAPGPEGLPTHEDHRGEILEDAERRQRHAPIEIRVCDPDIPGEVQPPFKRMWIRPAGALPEAPLVHAALLVYASDRTLLSTAARPHGLAWGKRMSASLDHAVWFHSPARFDDWVLYVAESPVARAARGLIHGSMWNRQGVRIASVAQEGLIRRPREQGL